MPSILRRRAALFLCAVLVTAGSAQAQNVTLSADGAGTKAEIAIDLGLLRDTVPKGVTGPVMSDSCGTTATVSDTQVVPEQAGGATIRVTLDLSRWQCIRVSEMVCKGFACRPVTKEQRTQLFGQRIYLSYALKPGILPGDRLTISADPALPEVSQRDLLARVPDFRRIDFALRNRISSALAPTARDIQNRLPDRDEALELEVFELDPSEGVDGLNFELRQLPADSE